MIELLPAIDLRGGRAVRLVQGDFTRETAYSDDPAAIARAFRAQGSRWVHVVDLDGARDGRVVHGDCIRAVVATGLQVELGGGLRDDAAVEAALDWGVQRVVVGTAAFARPDWFGALVRRHPGRVALGLDVRDGVVAVRGWRAAAAFALDDAVALAAGAAALVFTEIRRDGAMQGPDLEALRSVLRRSAVPVIASGGVRAPADLTALRGLAADGPLAGVIVGKAIYEGALDVAQALAALA